MRKVLVISHGHPDLNKGGGEQAAYHFFKQCLANGDDAYFLARTDLPPHGGAAFSTWNGDREILFHTTHDDFFLFSNIKTRHLWTDFKQLLQQIKPDAIYIHHYYLIGVETVKVAKQVLPNVELIVTLHEYHAICANGGLMVKPDKTLCYASGTLQCHQCLPKHSAGDFFLRKTYLQSMFKYVDHFISPSQFLKERYVNWGIAAERIHVIENGQPLVSFREPVKVEKNKIALTYIGQINPYKGIDVLLDALLLLSTSERTQFQLDIHGSRFSHQSGQYQKAIQKKLKKLEDVVRLHGQYELKDLASILEQTDWVIVPSIWWENSPMVIQEAFGHRKPLMVSDIGGMAEKVTHRKNGLLFRAGKPQSLADLLRLVASQPQLREQLAKNITQPITLQMAYEKTVALS